METIERQHVSIEDEMRRSYLDYAMSVIIGRALPDVRDGEFHAVNFVIILTRNCTHWQRANLRESQ